MLDRETRKHYPNGGASEVHRLYDLAGRPDSVRFDSPSGAGILYTHDAAGRLTSETAFGRTVSFGFDAASNRTQVIWPDANYIRYNADPLNRVDRICENTATCTSGGLVSYTLTPLSLRDAIARGNGSASDLDYDPAQRLSLLTHDVAGSDQDLTRTFGYTNAGQLNLRTNSNDDYEWEIPPLNRLYVANGLNQYASVDSTAHTHDLNGNLTSDGSRTFAYDIENRLTSVAGSASLTLTYDPLGRLKSTATGGTTTEYLYEGDRLIAEYQGSTVLRRYAHGPGVDEPVVWYEGLGLSDKRWLHADERGSIVATSNSSGTVTASTIYTYGPYGEPNTWLGSRFRYTGQIALLETGVRLYHYRARVYDPILGRFLQTDPVGYQDDLNLYAYAASDPLNRIDPLGEESYIAARAVDHWAARKFAKHEYIAVGADHPGDSKAEIISFGELKNGNMGNVSDPKNASSFSTTTNKTDREAWLSLKPDATEDIAKIDAPDEVVSAVAGAVGEGSPYEAAPTNGPQGLAVDSGKMPGAVNSNSAATAVKQHAERISNGQSSRSTISGVPGAAQSNRVKIECTQDLNKVGGC